MKQLCLLFFIITINTIGFSQDYLITGKVADGETKQSLEAATIYVESIRDSTLLSYTITNQKGLFELELRTKRANVNLFIIYNGYKTLKKQVELSKSDIDLGELALQVQPQQLEEVSVVGERVPITIKKDTLQFNADSFKTRPDANVQDLLKRLPGVAIDEDSKITVNGVAVDKLLVNGQEFFSDDPNIATKALSKEIIGQVQITDTKTATQEFTGEQGDGDSKTINLVIKEDKNKGYLGNLSAGYGTDERYQANGLLNHFNDKKRTSFLTSSNNINNPGFSFNGVSDITGATSTAPSSGGQGITTTSSFGSSYANTKKGDHVINGDYFFGNSDSFDEQKTFRENILPDGSFFTDSDSRSEGLTNSHRGSANLRFDIDKTLQVALNPRLVVNSTNSSNIASTISTDQDRNILNENETTTVGDGSLRSFSNRLNILKKLDTIGRYIGLSFSNTNSINTNISNFNSRNAIFGDNPSEEVLDQRIDTDNNNDSQQFQLTYQQPIKEKFFLNLGYSFSKSKQTNSRAVFDLNESTGDYSDLNESLSSDFSFSNDQQVSSLSLRHNGEKLRLSASANYFVTELRNQDFLQDTSFSKTFNNAVFDALANYDFGNNKRMRLRYSARLGIPSVSQLQPVPNVTNPLNIIVGNPNLSPMVSHSINFSYNNYNWRDRSGFFMQASGQSLQDKVTSVTTTDENFLRTTTYTNIGGNQNANVGLSYSKQAVKDSLFSVKVNIGSSFSYTRDVSFNNDQRLIANNYGVSPSISGTFNFMELVEIEPSYGLSFNASTYNVDGFEDIDFISHTASLRSTTYWPRNVVWGNDIRYTYNSNVGPGFDKGAVFWNMSLGLQLFDKKSMLKILAYDLLDQNINTRRTSGADFVQDFQGTVLKQYFMISFSHKFDRFGGKK